jgi:hypothetical protein
MNDKGCPNERTLDFDYCVTHLDTPRGKQHVMDVIARGNLTLPSMVEQAIKEAQEIPDVDYQTSALEKMADALDLIMGWVEESRANLDRLGGADNWRYKDRAQTEQQRTELGVYERALDRLSRHLTSMSKVALQEKIVTLGKAQVDLMIRLMMGTIGELKLDNETVDRMRFILLDKLSQEANLTPSIERHANEKLAIENQPMTVDMTGGVTGVSMRGERIA